MEIRSRFFIVGGIFLIFFILILPFIPASTTSTVTYTFTDKTNNKAYNSTSGSNWTAATRFTAGTELPAQGYTDIQTNNNVNATAKAAATNDYALFRYVFNLNQSASAINLLNITWIGARNPSTFTDEATLDVLIYNRTGNTWTRIGRMSALKGTNTTNFSGANVTNYIGSSNNVTIIALNFGGTADSGEGIATDFIKLDVTYTDNNPQWSSNSTNGTDIGTFIQHSINWTDDFSLSGYIFSFDNGTGSFVNDTFVTFTGTQDWSNVSKWVNTAASSTIRWRVFANDSANQVNSTDIFSYTTTTPPDIISPQVIINNPTNTTYYVVYDLPFNFNVSLDEPGSVMYSLDNETGNVIGNTTMYNLTNGVIGTDFNSTVDTLPVGNYVFNVYANDTSGNNNYSESVAFTLVQENIIVNGTVSDASGNTINTTFTIINEVDQSVVYNETDVTHEDIIIPLNTTYTVEVQPLEIGTVDQIEFNNLNFSDLGSITTEIVNVDENNNTGNFSTVFAIEPQIANFSDATVTFTAKSNSLFKCADWNFTDQSCGGNWTLLMKDLIVGNQYNFILNPGDPGYGIINISNATHLDENKSYISNITSQVRDLDGIWSETIPSGDYVRVVFQTGLVSKNDITIYPRTVSGTPMIEVYEVDSNTTIAEFSSINDNQYNTILLTNLSGIQDTFDLRVVGGSVEFDHIVDPTFNKRTYNYVMYTNHSIFWASPTQATFELGGGVNVSATNYTNAATHDNVNASTSADATNDGPYMRFNVTINEPASSISWINATVRGGETALEGARLYIYNFTAAGWINVSFLSAGAIGNISVNYTTAAAINSVISPNKQMILYVKGENFDAADAGALRVDYVEVLVGFTDNNPQWSSNTTNGTLAGTYILHSVNWTDQINLSGYIFSFNNGSGSFTNDTFVVATGTQNWANVSKWINTTGNSAIQWWVWANDSANQINSTSLFNYTTVDNPPKWSSNTTNGTTAGGYILHSVNITDDRGLSGYIFEFNNGTSYTNDTFVAATGTQNWANVSKWINTTTGTSIAWRVYFNDSANQINSTSLFNYTTTSASSCAYTSGNWNVVCNDNCSITSNVAGDGSNLTLGGFGFFYVMSNITGFKVIAKDNQCTVIKAFPNYIEKGS